MAAREVPAVPARPTRIGRWGLRRTSDPEPPAADGRLEAAADRFADRFAEQRESAAPGSVRPMPALDAAAPPTGTPGVPLDAATRAAMEPRLGWDLARIRVHTGRAAADSAAALGAQAYTVGRHIVLGDGVRPGSDAGQRLLAHELAHVAQQAHGEGRGAVHRKPVAPTGSAGRRRPPPPFHVKVKREMTPQELRREFIRQYFEPTSEREFDRRLSQWQWVNMPEGAATAEQGLSATAEDVRRGHVLVPLFDPQAPSGGLSPAEEAQIDAEADARFWQESGLAPGTKLGTDPKDAVLRARWRAARADAAHEHDLAREIAALPEDVNRILFGGGQPVASQDYEAVARLGRKLSALTRAQRADYLSRVNAGTTSWSELEVSIDRYLADRRNREAEADVTEEASDRLLGCEDLYRLWKRRTDLEQKLVRSSSRMGYSPVVARELNETGARFNVALARHKFADEGEFLKAIDTYRVRFRAEAVTLTLDVLARYDHLLYEAQAKLRSSGYVDAMVAAIARTGARTQYAAAAEKQSLARNTRAAMDPESAYQRSRDAAEAVRYDTQAASLRSAAEEAVVTGTGGDALVDPKQLGRGTDREKLAGLDAPAAKAYLLGIVEDRLADTAKARFEFTSDPERVFSLPDLVKATKQSQGAEGDTIHRWIVDDHIEAVRSAHVFSAVALGIIALVLAALVPVGGWVAAGALVTSAGIGVWQAREAVREYRQQSVDYRLSFIDEEPSLFWVGLAVAAAAIDLGMAPVQVIRASAKGLAWLEEPLRAYSAAADAETAAARYKTLITKIDQAEGLVRGVDEKLKVYAAAEERLNQAARVGRGQLNSGGSPKQWAAGLETIYHLIRMDTAAYAKRGQLKRLVALMGGVTKLSGPELEEIRTAIDQVKKIVAAGEKMDEAMVLRYVGRLAAERAGGESAFKALIADMRAWHPPTLEQIQTGRTLRKATEEFVSRTRSQNEWKAELHALTQRAPEARDRKRIAWLKDQLDGSDAWVGLAKTDLEAAETAAEAAKVSPVERMRSYFNGSKERAAVRNGGKATDQVGTLRAPSKGIEVDHIVSLDRISHMEGFDKLGVSERRLLAVRTDNLVAMDEVANASKLNRSWTQWPQASNYYTDPATIARWRATDARLTQEIQAWILERVRGR